MTIEQLLAALETDAAKERQATLARAQQEAERIRSRAREVLARRQADYLEPREREWRHAAAVTVAEARRRFRGEVLAARQRFLDRVFAAARSRLSEVVSDERYWKALRVHLDEALTYIGDESCVVRCPSDLAPLVQSLVPSTDSITVETDDSVPPGILVEAREGAVVVDNTLLGRLERLTPILAVEIVSESGVRV